MPRSENGRITTFILCIEIHIRRHRNFSVLRVNFGDFLKESGLKKAIKYNQSIKTDPKSHPIKKKCMENY
jgi:hypothetical protein